MSQNESISYPKIHQRFDGRIELVVYYQGRRLRLQNGKTFNINLKPNSFPESERLVQSKILAAQIYSKLLAGYNPFNKAVQNGLQELTDLEILSKAAEKKIKQGVSEHYERQFRYTLSSLSKHSSGEINQKIVLKVLDHFTNPTSYNTMRRSLVVLFNAAKEIGLDKNPMKGIKNKRAKARLNKPLTNTPALLKEISDYNDNLYLCCLFTYGCLLRPHREVRELKWGDFTEDLSYIRLSGSRNKSGRNRIVPVPYYVKEVLKKRDDNLNIFSGKEEPFAPDYFKGLWSRFKKRSKLLHENQTLYSFRHTGAINIYKRTGSIEKLKAAMGHSNIRVSDLFKRLRCS